jgi:hypothetical protein
MRRLSSTMTVFYKVFFPILWIGFTVVFTARVAIVAGAPAVIPAAIGLVVLFLNWWLTAPFADAVWLTHDDEVIVRKGGHEDRFPFRNVDHVDSWYYVNPERITLVLEEPCRFGREVAFLPPVTIRLPFTRHPLADELIEMVHRANN